MSVAWLAPKDVLQYLYVCDEGGRALRLDARTICIPPPMPLTNTSPIDEPVMWAGVLESLSELDVPSVEQKSDDQWYLKDASGAPKPVSHKEVARLRTEALKQSALNVLSLARVCRGWNVGLAGPIWRELCVHRWPSTAQMTVNADDFKRFFLRRSQPTHAIVTDMDSWDEKQQETIKDPGMLRIIRERPALVDALRAKMAASSSGFELNTSHVISQPYSDTALGGLVFLIDVFADGEQLLHRAYTGGPSVQTMLTVGYNEFDPAFITTTINGVEQPRPPPQPPTLQDDVRIRVSSLSRNPDGPKRVQDLQGMGCSWQFEAPLTAAWKTARLTASCALLQPATGKVINLVPEQILAKFDELWCDGPDFARDATHEKAPKAHFGCQEPECELENTEDEVYVYPVLHLLDKEPSDGTARVVLHFAAYGMEAYLIEPMDVRDILAGHGMIALDENDENDDDDHDELQMDDVDAPGSLGLPMAPPEVQRRHAKRPWTAEEDKLLGAAIMKYGTQRWVLVAGEVQHDRTGKQCRERWYNHLSPSVKKGGWTLEEDKIINDGVAEIGTKWSEIAKRLPGRTDNAIKNRYNSQLRKELRKVRNDRRKNADAPESAPVATFTPGHVIASQAAPPSGQSTGSTSSEGAPSPKRVRLATEAALATAAAAVAACTGAGSSTD